MIALVLLACRAAQTPPQTAEPPQPGALTIAHTNDLHAHFLPEPAPWLDGEPPLGGFVALDAHLADLRSDGEVLYLDGGDVLTGTPLMEYTDRGVEGGAMLSLLEAVGCDAFVLGNHEFDRGFAHTEAFVAASPIPVLSANLQDESGAPVFDGLLPTHTFEVAGLKVGVIGLTTYGLSRLTSGSTASRIAVLQPQEVAAEQVALLDPQTDLIIALTHIGLEGDRKLAEAVPGIDLVIGGHSHSSVEPPERIGETWVVQAGSYGRQLGVLRLQVADDRIVDFSGELVDLHPDALPAEPSGAVVALVEQWQQTVERDYGRTLGSVPQDIRRGEGESPLGRLAAEIVRGAAGADVGIMNAGGLRADLHAGPLTVRDLYEVFPFSNPIVTFSVKGDVLVSMLLRSVARQRRERSPLQLSGVRYTWRLRLDAPELVEAWIGGEKLDPDATYTIATNSYVAEQWRSNLGREPGVVTATGQTVLEAAISLAEQGPLKAAAEPSAVQLSE